MDTAMKIGLIVGAALVLLGLILFTVVMSCNRWDFSRLSTSKYITNTHPVTEAFSDIDLIVDTADIQFILSENGSCEVVCYEAEKALHSVTVEEGCLTLRVNDQRKWYEHMGINIGTPKITVTLPQKAYDALSVKASTGDVAIPKELQFKNVDISVSTGAIATFASVSHDVKLQSSTGHIWVEGITAEGLNISVTTGQVAVSDVTCSGDVTVGVSTGRARLTDMTCKNLRSTGSTGDLTLTNVVAAEGFDLRRSTGDIRFTKCDAAEILAKTDTGDVTGSLLSEKVFIAKTDTGRVNVPGTATGGRCEITTDTGNIKMEIPE